MFVGIEIFGVLFTMEVGLKLIYGHKCLSRSTIYRYLVLKQGKI